MDALGSSDEYRSFQLLHAVEMFKVDVFMPLPSAYTESEFSRSTRVSLSPSISGMFSAPENIIIQKLRWFEFGNRVSDRQWNDIVQIIEVQRTSLEWDYLNRWVEHFGLSELLARAKSQTLN